MTDIPPGVDDETLARAAQGVRSERSRSQGPGARETERESINGSAERSPPEGESLILPSNKFVAEFCPPDYLVDGILQRRFIYSMTGATGAGKTAVALLLAAHVAQGLSISGKRVEPGRVLYFAGENPDDVRMRWIGMVDKMGLEINTIDVHFIPGTQSISSVKERVRTEAERLGGFSLVIIDTSAAFFEGHDENDNKQMGAHARMLRELTTMSGGPCVLVLAHPVKNAGPDNLLPRGGGAFVAEMDGNLTCTKVDAVTLHWQGKFRGPNFEPISFELLEVHPPQVRDSRGRSIPTVVATATTPVEKKLREKSARADQEQVLRAMRESRGASFTMLIDKLGWPATAKSRLNRVMVRLEKDRLVKKVDGKWKLTEAGRKETAYDEIPA